eukprot:gene52530-15707_t
MLKDIILVNGQLRDAFDRAEASVAQLNRGWGLGRGR